MTNNSQEFLVTGQAYEKNDPYKQTILLHDSFFAKNIDEATNLFNEQFADTHHIMTIYSVVDVTYHRI